MKILVQFPTYARPKKFLECLSLWLQYASSKNEMFYNINCDVDDEMSNSQEFMSDVKSLFIAYGKGAEYSLNYDFNTDKISAINDHIQGRDFDVVICASDDMIPQVDNYDTYISDSMSEWYPDNDGALHFNDGSGSETDSLITLSILGKKLYDYFGYIYHPDYKSLYCDNEFTQCVYRLGKVVYIDKCIIKHAHYSLDGNINSGDTDLATNKTLHYSGRDATVFNERQKLRFPKQRITLD